MSVDTSLATLVARVCRHVWSDDEHILDPARKTGAADTDTVNLPQAQHSPTVFPRAAQLQDLAAFL